jgi:hypothetical protein
MENNTNNKLKSTLTKVKVNDHIQHSISAKIYSPHRIDALAAAIRDFGGMIRNPKVSRPNTEGKYIVFDGNRRILAAEMLGWEYIFVEVMENLPEEDESLFIVECNNYREKTHLEKYEEMLIYAVELPKRQGARNDKENVEKYDQRKAIAEKMDLPESQVRDLKVVGDSPNGKELLKSIDGKEITLTALARKVKQLKDSPNYEGFVACEQIDMEPLPCPVCNCHPTKRIEIRERELFFIN